MPIFSGKSTSLPQRQRTWSPSLQPPLIFVGDSIFDSAAYTAGGPAVIDQVRQNLPAGWQASLLAVDGDTTTTDVSQPLQRLPMIRAQCAWH